jgi:hypothetical protein
METKSTSRAAEVADPWVVAYNKLIFSQPKLTEPYFQPLPETYNIKKLGSDLALERSDFAAIVEKRPQDVQHYFAPEAAYISLKDQAVLKVVKELLGLRVLLSMLTVDDNAVLRWLKLPNPTLANRTPVECMKQSDFAAIADMLIFLLQENQTA